MTPGVSTILTRVSDLDDPRVADYHATLTPVTLRRRQLFVAEGRMVVRRLCSLPRYRVMSLLVTESAWASVSHPALPLEEHTTVFLVDQHVMNALVGFDIHRGCLALAARPAPVSLEQLPLAIMRRVLVLEGVSNPDNIGGLFRNAAAFGVDGVVLGPGCGDPLYRKAVRTSMGSTLSVPFVEAADVTAALAQLQSAGFTALALTPDRRATPLTQASLAADRVALLLGAEGDGLSPQARDAADIVVRIVTSDDVDSLNVSTAAAIALHHFARTGL